MTAGMFAMVGSSFDFCMLSADRRVRRLSLITLPNIDPVNTTRKYRLRIPTISSCHPASKGFLPNDPMLQGRAG